MAPVGSRVRSFRSAPTLRLYEAEGHVHSLGTIPFLPFLFDEPVEQATDYTFDRLERKMYPDETSPIRVALEAGKHHVPLAPPPPGHAEQ